MNRAEVIDVVRLPIALRGFGRRDDDEFVASEPYTLTIPDFELENIIYQLIYILKAEEVDKRGECTHPTAT